MLDYYRQSISRLLDCNYDIFLPLQRPYSDELLIDNGRVIRRMLLRPVGTSERDGPILQTTIKQEGETYLIDGLPVDIADYITWRYSNPYAALSSYDSDAWAGWADAVRTRRRSRLTRCTIRSARRCRRTSRCSTPIRSGCGPAGGSPEPAAAKRSGDSGDCACAPGRCRKSLAPPRPAAGTQSPPRSTGASHRRNAIGERVFRQTAG